MDNIVVNVKGSLTQNGQTEETEFLTTGSLKVRGGNKILSYMGASGGEDFTEITLAQGTVVLKKQENNSQDAAIVVLKEKQIYSSFYATPMGMVAVQVYPTLIHIQETENQGNIELEYVTNIADTQAVNRLQLVYSQQQ
ncbi:MAG: hypothetical protein DBY39_00895 [Clostridiales bacterium]|nr:MAG: hypothetical protein DBY39_00895 [Clostridiales bacterium]